MPAKAAATSKAALVGLSEARVASRLLDSMRGSWKLTAGDQIEVRVRFGDDQGLLLCEETLVRPLYLVGTLPC